jgi:hypothetical protein
MNSSFLLMMLLPFALSIVLILVLGWNQLLSWGVSGAVLLMTAMIYASAIYGSQKEATVDYEIYNGVVLSKVRYHGTYEESYDCNCKWVTKYRTDSHGKRTSYTEEVCQTCYRTHYTVKWRAETQLGDYLIDDKDELRKSVYASPDPARWLSINKGDPVSRRVPYTNYIQAVPGTLYTTVDEDYKKPFLALLPGYPEQIYDFYRLNRFVSPGFAFKDAKEWNEGISKIAGDLGTKKQVNLIVVIARTSDQRYALALQDHWDGVNKNDVVVVVGSEDGLKIDFVNILSWTKNERFRVQLQDALFDLKNVDREAFLKVIRDKISTSFERRRMVEFEYLAHSIPVPTWLLVTLSVLTVTGYAFTGYLLLSSDQARSRSLRQFFSHKST